MLYAMLYNTETEKTETRIFYSYSGLTSYMFSPVWECAIIDTKRPPAGRSYREKKSALHNNAVDYSYSQGADHADQLSWGELAEMQHYFTRYGRRYGLLTEFRENCII